MGPGRWGLWVRGHRSAAPLHGASVSSANQGRSALLTGSLMQVFELKPRAQDLFPG